MSCVFVCPLCASARAISAGATAYVLKPIDPAELKRKVRVLVELIELERKRARLTEQQRLRERADRLTMSPAVAREAARHTPPPRHP